LFRTVARRFRLVVWGAVAVLLTSGPVLLHLRGLSIVKPAEWPRVLTVKLGLVAILIALTAMHDLVVGPRVADLRTRSHSSHQILFAISAWLPRLSLVLALVVLWTAVMLARS
jgi:putative copper export protein